MYFKALLVMPLHTCGNWKGCAPCYPGLFQVPSPLTPGCLKKAELPWCLGELKLIGQNLKPAASLPCTASLLSSGT